MIYHRMHLLKQGDKEGESLQPVCCTWFIIDTFDLFNSTLTKINVANIKSVTMWKELEQLHGLKILVLILM